MQILVIDLAMLTGLRGLINMYENPYSEIINMMQVQGGKSNPPNIKIANVVHVEDTIDKLLDLKIEVDDLSIDKDNIYISDHLTKGNGTLSVNDLITVIPTTDKQSYVVLSKVVRIDE